MLKTLRVRDFALIDDIELRFAEGLNVLTGETGAGKSLIVDCLSLVAGGRADASDVKRGREAAVIEAAFDITGNIKAAQAASSMGLEIGPDGIVILSREVARSGKSKARIDGTLVSAGELQELAGCLIDIFGQHEGMALTKPAAQLSALDSFLPDGKSDLTAAASAAFRIWKEARTELDSLEALAADRQSRMDFLEYQLKEIEEAAIGKGEEAVLIRESRVLANSSKLYEALSAAYAATSETGDDSLSAMDQVRLAREQIMTAGRLGLDVQVMDEALSTAMEALSDAADGARNMRDSLNLDPDRAGEVEARLALIGRIKMKLRLDADEIPAFGEKTKQELLQLKELEIRTDLAKKKVEADRISMLDVMARLSEARIAAASELSKNVEEQLQGLMMPNARFTAVITGRDKSTGEDAGEGLYVTASGMDKVDFAFSANAGEEAMPLMRIASGGELSRFMLAFKVSGSNSRDQGATMVFDEIDQGIGGEAANFVASKLRKATSASQVLSVTHLAQIAAAADRHILVSKRESDSRTYIEAKPIEGDERTYEIARMLSGTKEREALEHAGTMISSWEKTAVKSGSGVGAATKRDAETFMLFRDVD